MQRVTCLDDIMMNYPLYYEDELSPTDSPKYRSLVGGKISISTENIPNGGFPPIYVCDKKKPLSTNIIEDEEKKKREYTTHKASVSIKSIMEKRRKITPIF